MAPRKLYKTTIVIWSDADVSGLEMSGLARDAECGDSYCSTLSTELVEDPEKDPHWDGTEFFSDGDEDAEPEEDLSWPTRSSVSFWSSGSPARSR